MLPIKETSLHNPEPLRNSSEKLKLRANQYSASITPTTVKTKPKNGLMTSQLKHNGDKNTSPITETSSPLFGNRL